MKRWKRRRVEEEDEEGSDEEELEDELDLDDGVDYDFDEIEDHIPAKKWQKLESKIRAGKYKPKHSDPWTLHVLYNNLKDLGRL